MFSFVRGDYFALSFRRGITHGWPALLVLPFLVAGAMLAWDRWVRRRRNREAEPARPGPILALSAIGLVTHPTLDWMNTYGMRWGLPFDPTWTYGDALFIIDPWIWLALGGAVFLSVDPAKRRTTAWLVLAVFGTALVGYAGGLGVAAVWAAGVAVITILARRGPTVAPALGRRAVGGVIAVVTAYIGLLVAADAVASAQVRSVAEAEGLVVRDVMVAPLPTRPLQSDVRVLSDRGFVSGRHSWTARPRVVLDVDDAEPLLLAPPGVTVARAESIAAAARRDPDVGHYLSWSRYPYVRIEAEQDGWRVSFLDSRYDDQPEAAGLAGITTWVADSEIP